MQTTLGVDVGGVLIDRILADGSDTSFFSDRFLDTPAVPAAFETLARLVSDRFGANAHIVSKCGSKTQEKTKMWLAHHRFHEVVGIPPERVHFCRERKDKAPICKRLGVTHFVDDRLDVLGYLVTVRILFGPQTAGTSAPPGIVTCLTWPEVEAAIEAEWDEPSAPH